MFKKSNRKFRTKKNDSDEDVDSNSNEVIITKQVAAKQIPAVTVVEEVTSKITTKSNTFLSFDLEEEENGI